MVMSHQTPSRSHYQKCRWHDTMTLFPCLQTPLTDELQTFFHILRSFTYELLRSTVRILEVFFHFSSRASLVPSGDHQALPSLFNGHCVLIWRKKPRQRVCYLFCGRWLVRLTRQTERRQASNRDRCCGSMETLSSEVKYQKNVATMICSIVHHSDLKILLRCFWILLKTFETNLLLVIVYVLCAQNLRQPFYKN